MDKIKQLQNKREQLAAEIRKLADKQKADGGWSAEDRTAWDAVNKDYDATKVELDTENKKAQDEAAVSARIEAIEADATAPVHNLIGRDNGQIDDAHDGPIAANGRKQPTEQDWAMGLQGWFRAAAPGEFGDVTEEHHVAARNCGINLASGSFRIVLDRNYRAIRNKARAALRNALSGVDGPAGGYTFGETFVGNLETAMLAFGGMFQVSEVIRTNSGEPMRWPTADDTSNTGEQIGENTQVDEADPEFGQVIWNAYKFTSKIIKVPTELLEDSAFDLASWLSTALGERLGRIQNTKYTTGTGAATAKGIVTAAAAGVTAASATAIAFDEVIDLEHSVDPSRRNLPGVGYMFHDNILKALRKLKDGNGRYLWQAGTNSGAPDTLNNRPYTINQDMASSISTGAITMLFGQLSQYKIRQVRTIRLLRLNERYADSDQVGFVAFVRGDGNLLDAGDNPVTKLTQA